MRFLPQKQLEDYYTKVIMPSVTYGLAVWGSGNKKHLNNLEKLHGRAGRILYGLPWDTSAEDVWIRTRWDSLETMYKLRLTEFVFRVTPSRNLKICFYRGILAAEEIRTSFSRDQKQIFIRNSIRFRRAIAWNTLTNKETRAKILKEFKCCLVKFDTDKMNFEPILATTKNRDIGYEYF